MKPSPTEKNDFIIPQEIIDQLEAEVCKDDFYQFVKSFWSVIIPDKPVYNWHIEFLCKELQLVGSLVVKRMPKIYDLVINIPPGSTKSTIATVMFPVWLWVQDPSIRIISSSYSSSLSVFHSVKSRDIIRSDKFKRLFPHIQIKKDMDGKENYENTSTGGRYTTSTGGTITGKHGHLIIQDDPVNPGQAHSEVKRKEANTFYDETLSSRKVDKAITPIITIMQRLHENDVTGHILSKKDKKVKHICLPVELSDRVKPASVRKKYKNGLLDPIRLSRTVLKDMKTDLGTYGYAGQFDQNPAPDEGGIIKKDWFGRFSLQEITLKAINEKKKLVWNFSFDGAYTAKEDNDPSAIMAWAYFENCLYIRAVQSAHLEFPELIPFIESFVRRNGYSSSSRIYIEPKASGLSAAQTLKRYTKLNVIIDKAPTEDKVARVRGISAFLEAGRCYLLQNGIWIDSFLLQSGQFPNAKNDDEVDVLVIAVNRSEKSKNTVKAWGSN